MTKKSNNSPSLRNVAVVAHVDHGKTTLIDALLRQTGAFHAREEVRERVMDSYELERERGITILAKNAAVFWRDTKINIIDTPGHADFGGEVERALHMASGVLLVVDAFEGPMPQTRFVLRKALQRGLRAVVALNKADRPGCDPARALDRVFDLFVELNANDEQLDFPVIHTSATQGWAREEMHDTHDNMMPLLDMLIDHLPEPATAPDEPLRMLVSNISYSAYTGREAIGRIDSGCLRVGDRVVALSENGPQPGQVERLSTYSYLQSEETREAWSGDIVVVAGLNEVTVGDTIAASADVPAFPRPRIDPPTVSMDFGVNTGPFSGREGDYVTSRHLRQRLVNELFRNVALQVEDTDSPDVMRVSGRGLLHLSILIEQMRRDGYELEISRPQVILREMDGKTCEPVENVAVEVPTEYVGGVMEIIGSRGGELRHMEEAGRFSRMEFRVPSRGLIGARSRLMSSTKGEAIFHHTVAGYEPVREQQMSERAGGVLVSAAKGPVTAYALMQFQDRGRFFVQPGDEVYEGMIVGECAKPGEISLNLTRAKHLTNIRSATKELTEKLSAARQIGLEDALEFIGADELVEVTPQSVRMRKQVLHQKARVKLQKQSRTMG